MEYGEFYKRIYKNLKEAGESNVHRRAAAQAREEYEASKKADGPGANRQ